MLNRRRALTLIPAGGLLLTAAVREKAAAASGNPFAFDTLTHCKSSVDFAKAFAAGMTGSIIDLEAFPRSEPSALAELGEWAKAAAASAASFRIIRQAADFQAAKDARKYAVVLASQDAAILETLGDGEDMRFATLAAYHELGLRDLQLTYNDRNKIGGGYWEDTQVPLSLYGRRLVAEMNRLGVIVDVSHSCQLTTLDAIKCSAKPVAVTHAGCRASSA
jgi:membrane dipeptidase